MAVGSAMGQGSFSWRGVAAGAVAGGLTAGASSLISSGASAGGLLATAPNQFTTLGKVVQGVAGYGASVVGNATAGLDTAFSWNAVAASAVGSFASAKLGGRVGQLEWGGSSGNFMKDAAGYFVNSASHATARRAMGLGSQDWDGMAVDAFGNALGNAAVGKLRNWQIGRRANAPTELLGPGTSFTRALNDPNYTPQWLEDAYSEYLASQADSTLKQSLEDIHANPELDRPLTSAERANLIEEQAAEAEARGYVWAGSAEENNILAWTSHAMQKGSGALYRRSVPMPTLATDSDKWRAEMHRPIHDAMLSMYPDHTDDILRDATAGEMFGRHVGQFLNGVGNVVAGLVVEPILMVADGMRAAYSVAKTETSGRLYEINMWSGIGKAAEAGATTGQLVQQMNPALQFLIAQHDLRDAYRRKDFDSFSYQIGNITGNVVAGAALGKFGGTSIAPGSLAGATRWTASTSWTATKWTWSTGKSVVGSMFDGPSVGSWRAQIGAVGDLSQLRPLGRSIGAESKYYSIEYQAKIEHPALNSAADLGSSPSWMSNAHDHHILQLNGRAGYHRALVREGQDILRQYGIDPIIGTENRIWAPNKGHTVGATEDLVGDLRAAAQSGEPISIIEAILRRHGNVAARR
jgi:hypothetical protein